MEFAHFSRVGDEVGGTPSWQIPTGSETRSLTTWRLPVFRRRPGGLPLPFSYSQSLRRQWPERSSYRKQDPWSPRRVVRFQPLETIYRLYFNQKRLKSGNS